MLVRECVCVCVCASVAGGVHTPKRVFRANDCAKREMFLCICVCVNVYDYVGCVFVCVYMCESSVYVMVGL